MIARWRIELEQHFFHLKSPTTLAKFSQSCSSAKGQNPTKNSTRKFKQAIHFHGFHHFHGFGLFLSGKTSGMLQDKVVENLCVFWSSAYVGLAFMVVNPEVVEGSWTLPLSNCASLAAKVKGWQMPVQLNGLWRLNQNIAACVSQAPSASHLNFKIVDVLWSLDTRSAFSDRQLPFHMPRPRPNHPNVCWQSTASNHCSHLQEETEERGKNGSRGSPEFAKGTGVGIVYTTHITRISIMVVSLLPMQIQINAGLILKPIHFTGFLWKTLPNWGTPKKQDSK